MPKRPAPLEVLAADAIDRAEARVREAGAVPAKKLIDAPLARAARAQLADALARRGLEQTGKHVRVPLREQLVAVLARDGVVSLPALRRALRGATSVAEVKHVIDEALRSGTALLVLRDGKEHLCDPGCATLAPADVDALLAGAAVLTKLRRKLSTSIGGVRPALLVEDVRRLIPELRPLPVLVTDWIVDALRRGTTRATPFAYLPDLGRRAVVTDASTFRATVAALARDGAIELRPESGLGLLRAGDADWCPRAPDGTVLSYARATGA